MIKVLVLSPCSQRDKRILSSASSEAVFTYLDKDTPPDILKKKIDESEIIIGDPAIEMIKDAPRLKLVQLPMAGTDIYTRSEGFPDGVVLANSSGAFGNIISQYVIGAILNICHNFHIYRDQQKQGFWHDCGIETGLYGKRVLIIGAGNIGSSVAARLSAFGTINAGIRRNVSNIPPHFDEMYSLEQLDSQLPSADIVVACIPNSDYTYHLFDEKKFMLMKSDAIFVNVGRGSLVVQEDLIKVLKSGHLKGVVLDVTEPEPLPKDSPLWYFDNIVITPHISGCSFGHLSEITDTIYRICSQNIKNYAEGKTFINVIDFKKFKK